MLVISRAKWLVFLWQHHQLVSGSANYFKLMQSCWPGEGRWASLKQPQQTPCIKGFFQNIGRVGALAGSIEANLTSLWQGQTAG